jgi:homoserine kinase
MKDAARVYAPGGMGNIGPGLDILGCALEGAGDTVTARRDARPGVRIAQAGHPDLPTDPAKHASGIAATEVLRRIGATDAGVTIEDQKGLPLSGGQGGSAASAVAAAVAVNELFGGPLDKAALLDAALAAESAVAGRHADNVGASLHGGIILVRGMEPVEIVHLAVPAALRFVLVHPHHRLSTAESRRVLPKAVDLRTAVHQAAQVAAMVAALHSGDLALFGRAIDDRIAEPARIALLPGFVEAKAAALEAGALGCSISGAGPSVFAVVDSEGSGDRVCRAMREAYDARGIATDGRVARVDQEGARALAIA